MQKALVNASDSMAPDRGYDLQIIPINDSNTTNNVFLQSKQPGNKILWMGVTKDTRFFDAEKFISESTKYSGFTHAYVYDEIFWGRSGFSFGEDEDEIINVARMVRENGMKAVIVAMPDVVLHPDFKMKDINAVDVIAIDVYPSIRVSNDLHGCKYNENLYSNLLYCTIKKLRDAGFVGEIWYVYQAFGIIGEDQELFRQNLILQKETIQEASKFGVVGIVPWGLYLGKYEIEKEPYLYQLKGTQFQSFVE